MEMVTGNKEGIAHFLTLSCARHETVHCHISEGCRAQVSPGIRVKRRETHTVVGIGGHPGPHELDASFLWPRAPPISTCLDSPNLPEALPSPVPGIPRARSLSVGGEQRWPAPSFLSLLSPAKGLGKSLPLSPSVL